MENQHIQDDSFARTAQAGPGKPAEAGCYAAEFASFHQLKLVAKGEPAEAG
jgi:hypothetical protein